MEQLKHECGIAMVRLLKPLKYYKEKYGTYQWGLDKLYLMMEKQHNRGQEGAGIGCVSLKSTPGKEYIFRERALGSTAITEVFESARKAIANAQASHIPDEEQPFVGEVYMGHLRYSTTGKSGISNVHPFLRRNNWRSRNMILCGNFNMTNVEEIFSGIVAEGQHPRTYSDTVILLEQIGAALDNENQHLFEEFHRQGFKGIELTRKIEDNISIKNVIKQPASTWDGGYVICGALGSGDMFVLRDPHGIRPCFYYANDEVFVATSERPVLQTALNITKDDVQELTPGKAVVVGKNGSINTIEVLPQLDNRRCSFERIYFSRGTDADIYRERKQLGLNLTDAILKAVDNDIEHTVLSFIPNTAEMAYLGMCEGFTNHLNQKKYKQVLALNPADDNYKAQLKAVLEARIRVEKIANKDIKLRTFIAEGTSRNELAAHVYDVTYGQVRKNIDNLVVIDDSIVRGTTLKQSIVKILDRLQPKKIIIVSSSPQVRYPDYYGIDMSRMAEFCAFRAAIDLLKERGMQNVIDETYRKCKAQENLPKEQIVNEVTAIYAPFKDEEISAKIVEAITDEHTNAEVQIIYQTLEGLHAACPDTPGDWYFSGNYPSPGGNKMVNQAFINWYEGHTNKRYSLF